MVWHLHTSMTACIDMFQTAHSGPLVQTYLRCQQWHIKNMVKQLSASMDRQLGINSHYTWDRQPRWIALKHSSRPISLLLLLAEFLIPVLLLTSALLWNCSSMFHAFISFLRYCDHFTLFYVFFFYFFSVKHLCFILCSVKHFELHFMSWKVLYK